MRTECEQSGPLHWCDRPALMAENDRLRAEVETLRADAGRWRHVWRCVRIAQHGEYVLMPDDPTGLAEDSIARAYLLREVDAAIAKAEGGGNG